MPILLAIDTAAPRLQLALLRADGSVDTLVEDMAQGQAERILPAIGELLARNGIRYPDLDRIAVTTGPGSFTGLRIGLSAARGLGLALGIPVLGVPSLQAISLQGGPFGLTDELFTVAIDARRGEQYVQSFVAPGVPADEVAVMRLGGWLCAGQFIITEPWVPIALLARFAATADPAAYPPNPRYIRGADAKPQDKARIARVPAP
jgi:tRNA threonylcarbamoyl adenosine modification protein YeaZ